MVYLIENADEICEKFKPNHEYPPWQAAPQASSKSDPRGRNVRKARQTDGEAHLRAAVKALWR
jgi:hypothetical protein